MSGRIAALLAHPDVTAAEPRRHTRHEHQLDPRERAILDAFQAWLVDDYGLLPSTAQPYRSRVAKCLADPDVEMTAQDLTAARAFRAFMDQR